ncbi:hypothetical protein N0V84_008675 [Fusarium piperis]|uniref:Uncharacterized protein n=1 Tax=Fusarium piperis TaxID=1435070 RepID=A0A9W9BJI4_9HYPO|nr:hypothetical protein N0V84_008675 [Fusarium piperis]
MPTLLHVLTRSNVNVDSSLVPRGPNTTIQTEILAPDAWRPWHGFDYATLTTIFRRDLDKEYVGSAKPEPLPQDLCIFNEETLDDVLRRFEIPIVNYCLNRRDAVPHFGRGSRCGTSYKPDWSVISPLCLNENQFFANVLPGDTKLSKKWWPSMGREGGTQLTEWQKVIKQIVTYMAYNNSRYGFIITDECLVALRLTRMVTPETLAANRPSRATAGHTRYASDASMEDRSASVYEDTDALHWSFEDPEYIIVPWKAHGSRLTPKLTLWFLAMMAANGDKFLDYSYPDLDSWRRSAEGDYYVHNTSGAKKSRLSRGEQVQQPDLGQGNWGGVGGHEEWDRDEPSFSQISDDFGGDRLGNYGDEEEEEEEEEGEASDGDDDDDDDEEGEEEQTEGEAGEAGEAGGSSGPQKKPIEVKIQKSRFGRGLYFLDAKKHKKQTTKREWTKIEGGYMLSGRKHVYFTKKFP